MIYNRFQEQCQYCACWCENIANSGDPETIKIMEKYALECTQELSLWIDHTPCPCFLANE